MTHELSIFCHVVLKRLDFRFGGMNVFFMSPGLFCFPFFLPRLKLVSQASLFEDLHLDLWRISKDTLKQMRCLPLRLPQQETLQFVRLNARLLQTADPFKGAEDATQP